LSDYEDKEKLEKEFLKRQEEEIMVSEKQRKREAERQMKMDDLKRADFRKSVTFATLIFWFVLIVVFGGMWGCPKYNVWQKGLEGQAELAQASFNRQIKVNEAEAQLESSKYLSAAEIQRARGVAEANKIIGTSLKNNEDYLKYLWIHTLEGKQGEVIYVPTEANLPILEATRNIKPKN